MLYRFALGNLLLKTLGSDYILRSVVLSNAPSPSADFQISFKCKVSGKAGLCWGRDLEAGVSSKNGLRFNFVLDTQRKTIEMSEAVGFPDGSHSPISLLKPTVCDLDANGYNTLTILKTKGRIQIYVNGSKQAIANIAKDSMDGKEIGFVLADNSSILVDWLKVVSCE